MRDFPHAPDASVFESNFQAAAARLARKETISGDLIKERGGDFLPFNAKTGLECALRAYALEQDDETVRIYFREAAWSFGKAIEVGAPVHLADYVDQLSVALILRDQAQVMLLSGLNRSRYTHPDMEFAEILYRITGIEAEMAAGRLEAAREQLAGAQAELAARKHHRIVLQEVESVLPIEQAILDSDQAALQIALQCRHDAYHRKFTQPRIRHMAEGAIDLRGLGLVRLGLDAGLQCTVQSVYFPLHVLAG